MGVIFLIFGLGLLSIIISYSFIKDEGFHNDAELVILLIGIFLIIISLVLFGKVIQLKVTAEQQYNELITEHDKLVSLYEKDFDVEKEVYEYNIKVFEGRMNQNSKWDGAFYWYIDWNTVPTIELKSSSLIDNGST